MITGREELSVALGTLCRRCRAQNIIVIDTQNHLYGLARYFEEEGAMFPEGIDLALNEAVAALAPRTLRNGGRLDFSRSEAPLFFMARSFAGVYILLLWFGAAPPADARRLVSKALPDIEALTLRMPPEPLNSGPQAWAKRLPFRWV